MERSLDLERILDFEIGMDRVATEQVVEHEWGTSFLCPSIPLVWDCNWVLIERPGLSAAEIAAVADEVIGGAGLEHRAVLVRDMEAAAGLAAEFRALGWSIERDVTMQWRRPPDRGADVAVEEVGLEEIVDLRRELIRDGLPAIGGIAEQTTEQLLEWDRMLGAAGAARWFMARAQGRPAACCQLLSGEGIGQIEDVGTLPAARERGLGRAITLAAAQASAGDGNRITYLGARADDWPRLIYTKLGFDELGEGLIFRRTPPGLV
jgi:ribosomal protein S18 acetylase RimI-like enzyme